jgi:hypothetical protein
MLPKTPKNYLYAFGLNIQNTVVQQTAIIEEESLKEEAINDVLFKTVCASLNPHNTDFTSILTP